MAAQRINKLDKARNRKIASPTSRPSYSRAFSLPAVNSKSLTKSDLTTPAITPDFLGDDWSYLSKLEYFDSWTSLGDVKAKQGPKSENSQISDQRVSWTPAQDTEPLLEEPMDISAGVREADLARKPSVRQPFEDLTRMEPSPRMNIAPVATMLPRQPSPRANTRGGTMTCLEKVLQAALSLHTSDKQCKTMVSTIRLAPKPLDFDQVLLRNRETVKQLDSTLGCFCASEPDVLLACCLALTEVVSWYGTAMDTSNVGPVTLAPISMGSYSLDITAQRSVLARVVLSELKTQVQPLLAKFPKHNIVGFAGNQSGSNTVGGQQCALRAQIRSVVLKANDLIRS